MDIAIHLTHYSSRAFGNELENECPWKIHQGAGEKMARV